MFNIETYLPFCSNYQDYDFLDETDELSGQSSDFRLEHRRAWKEKIYIWIFRLTIGLQKEGVFDYIFSLYFDILNDSGYCDFYCLSSLDNFEKTIA